MTAKKLTKLALLTTLSLIIFTIESAIPPLVPIPGIKLGLANIITLITLHNFSAKDTLCVLFVRILLSSFFFGQAMSFFYSLSGGIFSFFAMYAVNYLLQGYFLFLTSIAGALFHNLGQLLIAYIVTEVTGVFVYFPFLCISGIVTGLFTGLCANFSQQYLKKLKFFD